MDENQLSDKNLTEVYESVLNVATKWYDLGLSLQISVDKLKGIKSHCSDDQSCLREMLTHWLQTSRSCTWIDIYNGLTSDAVQRMDIARSIRVKCKLSCRGVAIQLCTELY